MVFIEKLRIFISWKKEQFIWEKHVLRKTLDQMEQKKIEIKRRNILPVACRDGPWPQKWGKSFSRTYILNRDYVMKEQ